MAGPPRLTGAPLTVIFDLDGTLVDSADDVGDLFNPLLAELGRRQLTREDVVACFGLGAAKFVQRAFQRTGGLPDDDTLHSITARFMAAYTASQPVRSIAYPGAEEALRACRAAGWRVGLCTNKPLAATILLLAHLGLDHWFHGISGGDSIAVRKPDPAHLLHAIQQAGGDPSHAILVGDSETDAACAAAAGIPVILVAGGYHHGSPAAMDAAKIIPSLAALPDLLHAMQEGRPGLCPGPAGA